MHWADEATLRAVATRVCKRYVVVTVFMVVSGMSYRKGTFQAGRIVPRRVQTRIGGIIQFAAEHYLDWMRSFAAPIKGAAHLPVLREFDSLGCDSTSKLMHTPDSNAVMIAGEHGRLSDALVVEMHDRRVVGDWHCAGPGLWWASGRPSTLPRCERQRSDLSQRRPALPHPACGEFGHRMGAAAR